MLQDDINKQLIIAMKAKDSEKVSTLRMINAAIKEKEISLRGTRNDTKLSDSELIILLKSMIKSRENSIHEYQKAGREDYVLKEQNEIKIINQFLPKQYSEQEIISLIDKILIVEADKSMKAIKSIIAKIQKRADIAKIDMAKVAKYLKDKLTK